MKAVKANYDLLFSAPQLKHLESKECNQNNLVPGKKYVVVNGVAWVQSRVACEPSESYANPHIIQTEKGEIIASYGATSYRLKKGKYKSCHLIGYDGVGCYF